MSEYLRPRPEAASVRAMTGKISEPVQTTSYKPGPTEGKPVTVRLVQEGAGLWELEDWADNREWSGIGNHSLIVARLSSYLASELQKGGYQVDPRIVLNGSLHYHNGRRVWDEAGWYRDAVPGANEKRKVSNELLGFAMLKPAGVRQDTIEFVAVLSDAPDKNENLKQSWDYKILLYADHRISQHIETLPKRMADFLMNYFFDRATLNDELKTKVYQGFEQIVIKGREGKITLEEAVDETENLGARETSDRLDLRQFMELVLLDAETEAELIKLGIKVDELNDNNPPMPRWERYIRRLYLHDAEEKIFEKFQELRNNPKELDKEFPPNTWWGQVAREIYELQNGKAYHQRTGKARGIQRSIDFFNYLSTLPKK
jgi:hypothetical protein